jgi:hypothetical protein
VLLGGEEGVRQAPAERHAIVTQIGAHLGPCLPTGSTVSRRPPALTKPDTRVTLGPDQPRPFIMIVFCSMPRFGMTILDASMLSMKRSSDKTRRSKHRRCRSSSPQAGDPLQPKQRQREFVPRRHRQNSCLASPARGGSASGPAQHSLGLQRRGPARSTALLSLRSRERRGHLPSGGTSSRMSATAAWPQGVVGVFAHDGLHCRT